MDLTKQFTEDQYMKALSSWYWLEGLDALTPGFASLFGDLFLVAEDRSWWFLDTMEGAVTREWPDHATMQATLDTEEGQDRYLMGGLALGAFHRRGLELGPDQVYAWAPPPMVTGRFETDDIQVFPFVVAVHIAGQFHAPQVIRP